MILTNKNRRLFLQLGRLGDILNILPVAYKHFLDTGERPWFMAAREFADVLDGCGYVEPVTFEGDFTNVPKALYEAREITDNICVSQIYGIGLNGPNNASSFAIESWDRANAKQSWGTLPLVFDKRNEFREKQVIQDVFTKIAPCHPQKELLLVAMKGTSSPFPWRVKFMDVLDRMSRNLKFEYFDISDYRAHRIYDLLGLFEKAACLITIDTAIVHLARACKIPVAHLVGRWPDEWHAVPWSPQDRVFEFYDQFSNDDWPIIDVISKAMFPVEPPTLVHVYTFPGEMPQERYDQIQTARTSWEKEYVNGNWKSQFFPYGLAGQNDFGVPFVKDMLDYAADRCERPEDIIVYTNADVLCVPGITGKIMYECKKRGCAFTHRYDFASVSNPFVSDSMLHRGRFYPGTDAFFFTKRWWSEHKHEMPNMLVAKEKVDEVLRQLVKMHGGKEIKRCIYHQVHTNSWFQRPNDKGNQYNLALAEEWRTRTGLPEQDWRWWSEIVHQL